MISTPTEFANVAINWLDPIGSRLVVELKEGCWVLRIITNLRHDNLPTKGLINPCCEVPYLRGRQYSGSQYFMKGVGGVEIGVIQIWSE